MIDTYRIVVDKMSKLNVSAMVDVLYVRKQHSTNFTHVKHTATLT
jgi:hypothetical protein